MGNKLKMFDFYVKPNENIFKILRTRTIDNLNE